MPAYRLVPLDKYNESTVNAKCDTKSGIQTGGHIHEWSGRGESSYEFPSSHIVLNSFAMEINK